MAAPPIWAERKFSFDFPVELYPNVLMRLRGTPGRLAELLGGADEARVRRRPAAGKWSALERAGHLIEIERLWEKRVGEYLAGADALTPADMSNAVTTAADYNTRELADVLAGFRAARTAFVARLDALAPADFARTALHPRLKVPMRLVDGLYFTAEHDDHELAWMRELVRG
jgi:hypothetical protein